MAWPTNGYVLNSAHNTISQLSSFVMAKEAMMDLMLNKGNY